MGNWKSSDGGVKRSPYNQALRDREENVARLFVCYEVIAKGSRLIDATSFLHIFDLNSDLARSRIISTLYEIERLRIN